MKDLMTLSQAAKELRVSPNTVTAWAEKLKIEVVPHPYDGRMRLISVEGMEMIRAEMESRDIVRGAIRPGTPPKEIERPIPSPATAAPPELRVTDARAMTKSQLKALTIEQKRALARPWPDGWHTVDALRTQHGLHPQVIENAELEGHFTIELGVWKKGNVYVLSGISAEEYPKFLAWIERHTAKFRGKRKRPDEVPPSLPLPE